MAAQEWMHAGIRLCRWGVWLLFRWLLLARLGSVDCGFHCCLSFCDALDTGTLLVNGMLAVLGGRQQQLCKAQRACRPKDPLMPAAQLWGMAVTLQGTLPVPAHHAREEPILRTGIWLLYAGLSCAWPAGA